MQLHVRSITAIFPWLILFAPGVSPARGEEGGWPERNVVAEGSESPDGRYGVLLPSRLVADALDDDAITNTLVDLKKHRRLAVIRGAHYFPGQNHRGLGVDWAADSSWCAVTFDGRYGFDTITGIEIEGTTCKQTDLGSHIQKALDSIIAKQAREAKAGGYGNAYFRAVPGRKILVRATAFTNPKGFPEQGTYCALFQGTFDLASGKWTRSDASKIASADAFDFAYGDRFEEGITFASEENRLSWHDERLNEVYRVVRTVLPAARFAGVKKEQIAWLKRLEASDSTAKKCTLIAARVQELRQLVW